MSQSPLIKTWQQLVAVVAAAFIVPIVVILLIASLITSGRKGGAEAGANVLTRIAPVGTVVVDASAPGVTATAAGSPSAPAATPKPAAPVVAAAIPPPPAPAAAAKADGKKVYDTACTACHTPGIAGAPKVGDKAGWSPRIAQGANVLYEHAIKGYQGKNGVMPAKGGNTALSDADVKAAVDYMTSASK